MRRLLLPAALLLTLFLRWPLASHDVEHYIGPDEGEVVENVLEMLRMGDFDHRHRGYPGFHFYLQMIPLAVHRAAQGRPIPDLPRSGFYLIARRVTLVAGVAAVLVVFAAGRRFLSEGAALLAAALVLVSPLASRESAVVNPDLMLSFFTAVSLLCSLRLLSDRRTGSFLLAGASLGLATAVKYTGGFALVPYLCACLGPRLFEKSEGTTGFEVEARRAAAGLLAAGLVFALASPYTLVHLGATLAGLGTHASYYNASGVNGALELLAAVFFRGLGPLAASAALLGAVLALSGREPHRLVVLSFPVAYLLVFAFFGRAFPRHALVLLAPLALLAGSAWEALTARGSKLARSVVAALLLASPLWGSIDLARRSLRPTPADQAKRWAESELPLGSRVLEDQFTPALDPERLRTHRLRVEERVFLGNFDWALVSGYPPGIETTALREIRRFEPEGALGDAIRVYQIPPRETLMPVTLPLSPEPNEVATREIGAGELPYFGGGWQPPGAGAFETSRLSQGEMSELFFVLPRAPELPDLEIALTLGPAVPRSELEVDFEINGRASRTVKVGPSERDVLSLTLAAPALAPGANRLVLRYSTTERLDRRRPDTAIRLYRFALTWKNRDRLR